MKRYVMASMIIVALLLISIVNVNLQNKAPAPAPGAPMTEVIARPDKYIIIKAPVKLEVEGPNGVVFDPWATTAYHLFGRFDSDVSCSSTYPCYFECALPGVTNAGVTTGADGVTMWCVFQPSTSSGSSTAVRLIRPGVTTQKDITQVSWSGLDTSTIYAYRLSAPLWYNYTDNAQGIEVRQHVLPPFASASGLTLMSRGASSIPDPWSITVFDSLGNQVTTGWSASVSTSVVNQTHLRIRLSISFSSTFTLQRIVVTRSWTGIWSQPYLAMDVRFLSPVPVSNGYVMVIDKFVV
ncbi:MAG: hypothetical protein QW512_06765, partial [Thermofilaceae archaeon]